MKKSDTQKPSNNRLNKPVHIREIISSLMEKITRAKEAKDKARDRFFTKSGYKVLRFTGSEIFADPEKCREDIDVTLSAIMTDMQDRFGGK